MRQRDVQLNAPVYARAPPISEIPKEDMEASCQRVNPGQSRLGLRCIGSGRATRDESRNDARKLRKAAACRVVKNRHVRGDEHPPPSEPGNRCGQ
ncbi:MAG: hypothetical protein ACRDLL_01600 [Solirubrobacterales bacterium]